MGGVKTMREGKADMRRARCGTWCVSLLLLATHLAAGPIRADEGDESSPGERSVDIIPLPVIFSSPETGFAFGAAVVVITDPSSGGYRAARPNVLQAVLFYTTEKQILGAAVWEKYLGDDRYRLVIEGLARRYPDKFYGIGPDSRSVDEEDYTFLEFSLVGTFQWRIAPGLYLGPSYLLSRNTLDKIEEGGLLDTGDIPGAEGVTSSGLGFRLNYDMRDDRFYPLTGRYAEFEGGYSNALFGGTREYFFIGLDYREYFPLFARSVLALQYIAVVTGGEVPFQYMPKLGDLNVLRGYREGRFRDKATMIFQAEYRFPVVWRLGATVFGGFGQVGPSLGHLPLSDVKAAGGFGIRYRISDQNRVNLRLDFAFSPQDFAMYVNFAEAF
jgi:outer membrane protein assembly factor BamA